MITHPGRPTASRKVDLIKENRLTTTHRSRRRSSERTAGVPWNLTFADTVEKGMDDDSNGMDAPTRSRHRSAKVEVCATT